MSGEHHQQKTSAPLDGSRPLTGVTTVRVVPKVNAVGVVKMRLVSMAVLVASWTVVSRIHVLELGTVWVAATDVTVAGERVMVEL